MADKKERPGARVITPPIKEKFLDQLRRHRGNLKVAAKNSGRMLRTFYLERDRDPDFKAAWEKAREDGILTAVDLAEDTLMKRIAYEAEHPTGKLTATIFFLKTKGRSRGYNELREVTHNFSLADVLREIDDDRQRRIQTPRLEVAQGSG